MLKNTSQKKTIPKFVFPGGVCNPYNMSNHDGRKVDLFLPIHQIDETPIHSIGKVAALTPRDDIFYDEPKQQLM